MKDDENMKTLTGIIKFSSIPQSYRFPLILLGTVVTVAAAAFLRDIDRTAFLGFWLLALYFSTQIPLHYFILIQHEDRKLPLLVPLIKSLLQILAAVVLFNHVFSGTVFAVGWLVISICLLVTSLRNLSVFQKRYKFAE